MTEININTSQNLVNVNTEKTEVTITTLGPQGPKGTTHLIENEDVDATLRVDKSLLYYNAATEKFVADADVTTLTLTDGGNF